MIGKHVRLKAQRRDGSEFPMSISFSVAEIRDNLYFTGVIRDITEYQEMQDRLLQSGAPGRGGQHRDPHRHEIKNPLLIIGGFARQLLKIPGLDNSVPPEVDHHCRGSEQPGSHGGGDAGFCAPPSGGEKPGPPGGGHLGGPGTVPGHFHRKSYQEQASGRWPSAATRF